MGVWLCGDGNVQLWYMEALKQALYEFDQCYNYKLELKCQYQPPCIY